MKKLLLNAYDIQEGEHSFYFVSNQFNAIFQTDKITKKTKFIESIPEEKFWGENLISKMIRWRDKVVFVPMNAKNIWIKNLKTRSWKKISLRNREDIKSKFFQAIQYNHKVYLVGCNYPSIVCLDMEEESIKYIDEVMKKIDADCHHREKIYFRRNYVQINSCFYMASCKTNAVVEFNMENEVFRLIKIGDDESRYSGIAWDGDNFWLSSRLGGVVTIWNKDTINSPPDKFDFNPNGRQDFVYGIVFDKNKISLIMEKAVFSVLAKTLEAVEKSDEKYWIYDCSDKTVRLTKNGALSICRKETEEFSAILEIDKNTIKEIFGELKPSIASDIFWKESNGFDLETYIWAIDMESQKKIDDDTSEKIGEKIWNIAAKQ